MQPSGDVQLEVDALQMSWFRPTPPIRPPQAQRDKRRWWARQREELNSRATVAGARGGARCEKGFDYRAYLAQQNAPVAKVSKGGMGTLGDALKGFNVTGE